jgi:hypothetical protein
MAIRVSWDNPDKTVLYVLFEGRWHISEFDTAVNQILAFARPLDYPVYSICDMTRCGAPPVGIMWQARRAYQMAAVNWGGTVIATRSKIVIDLLGSFLNAYAPQSVEKIIVVSTLEEAREFLAHQYVKPLETG